MAKKQKAIPLQTLRLIAERPSVDRLGVIPSFYIEQAVLSLESSAKHAREREDAPAPTSDPDRQIEQACRRARTHALEDAARRMRQAYEAGLNYWIEDGRDP